jgi:hypothetical protein
MTQDEYSDSPFTIPDGEIHKQLPEPMQTVFLFAVVLELATRSAKKTMHKKLYKPQTAQELNQKANLLLSDIRAECVRMIAQIDADPEKLKPQTIPGNPMARNQE